MIWTIIVAIAFVAAIITLVLIIIEYWHMIHEIFDDGDKHDNRP